MAQKGLYDLSLISPGDVKTYLATLTRSTAFHNATLLSEFFHEFHKNGVIEKNFFIPSYTVDVAIAKHSPWALFLARRSGPAFEQALLEFTEKNRRQDGDMVYRLSEIETAARWMVVEEIESLSEGTKETMRRYHHVGLRGHPRATAHTYYYFAASFLRFLLNKKLIRRNEDAVLPPYERVPSPPPMTEKEENLHARFKALETPSLLPQDFTLLNIDARPLEERVFIARKYLRIQRVLGFGNSKDGPFAEEANRAPRFFTPKEYALAIALNMVEPMGDRVGFSHGFITRFQKDAKALREWAGAFQAKLERNEEYVAFVRANPPLKYANRKTFVRVVSPLDAGP
jgi:hypothetical protein